MSTHRLRRAVASAGAAVALSATMVGTAHASDSPSAEGSPHNGCPYGAVCIYNPAGEATQTPEHVYWSYGKHQLYNEFGPHYIVNNQSGGANVISLGDLPEYQFELTAGTAGWVNLTTIDGLWLYAN
ncbi:hypothetical protein [Ruania zhangjianzhongii]|uniref:hypothetical protein n=1 Tax=Ruania zhangjianzhongii TaxID=2603206 RepID=UPI0011C70654|nr:hypothetical protein [Ruania zhangjianzhongii]